jgi:hypothetical protein
VAEVNQDSCSVAALINELKGNKAELKARLETGAEFLQAAFDNRQRRAVMAASTKSQVAAWMWRQAGIFLPRQPRQADCGIHPARTARVAPYLTVVADVAADSNPRYACARLESAPTKPVSSPSRVFQLAPRFNEVLPTARPRPEFAKFGLGWYNAAQQLRPQLGMRKH